MTSKPTERNILTFFLVNGESSDMSLEKIDSENEWRDQNKGFWIISGVGEIPSKERK